MLFIYQLFCPAEESGFFKPLSELLRINNWAFNKNAGNFPFFDLLSFFSLAAFSLI